VGEIIIETGNWHIDCPPSGPNDIGLNVNGGLISIEGNVVMDGGLDLNSDARFFVNADNSEDGFLYLRDGLIIKRANATLVMNRTFVHLRDGAVDIRAGTTGGCPSGFADPMDMTIVGICWTAPNGGSFEDLALWSEAPLPHEIGGQGGNNLAGTFFTPNAEPFSLTGQGGQLQFRAQFITRRLEVKGQGVVEMTPDPDRTTPIPARAVALIR
jgi:hypothetical protein